MKLVAKDVSCGWEKSKPVQTYVNFSIESGEVCCILGPNGCGKTTLLKTLMGLVPRLAGAVGLDGRDIRRYTPKERAKSIAYVSQGHVPPFSYRVRDVVMLGRTSKVGLGQPAVRDRQIAESALKDMGVWHLRDERYTEISGGQLQLVMIARALAQQPQLLVLDEPTAALDYGHTARVVAKIRELAQRGYAVLMTTHSPDQAFLLNSNVLLLQRDRPPQFGSAVDVITEKNMRDAYGTGVEVKEFLTRRGSVVRMCAPVLEELEEQNAGDAEAQVDAPDAAGEPADTALDAGVPAEAVDAGAAQRVHACGDGTSR